MLWTFKLCVTVSLVTILAVGYVTGVTTLQVVWIAPATGHAGSSFPFNASSSIAGLALALQTIHNESILPDHDFNITWLDSDCNSKQSLGLLVDELVSRSIDVVIGPPCSNVVQTVGELLAYRNIPLFNWMSVGQTLTSSSKDDLNTYVRAMAPVSSLGGIMMLFYFYTGWRRFVVISCRGDDYVGAAATIEDSLELQSFRGFYLVHHYSEISTNAATNTIDQILSSIIYEARIIILVIPRGELRAYLLRAHVLGMVSGDYQFLYSDPSLLDQSDIDVITSDVLWKLNDEYDDMARQAFENVLYFALGHESVNQSTWMPDAMTAVDTWFAGRTDLPTPTEPNEFLVYLHDTLVLYARAVNVSLTEGGSTNGTDIFKWTPYANFKGLSGDVVMGYLCDRQPYFIVYDLSSTGVFQQVASLKYVISGTRVIVESEFTQIVWGDGQKTEEYIPPDTPVCGFLNENCPPDSTTDNSTVVIAVVTVTMLVVLLAFVVLFRWWKWEQSLKNTAWKIAVKDLDFAVSKRATSTLNISGRFAQSMVSLGSEKSGRITACNQSLGGQSAGRRQVFTTIAMYKGDIVAVKKIKKKKLNIDRALLLEMKQMEELKHTNLTSLVGLCTATDNICAVWEYCNKGSVQDVIQNDDIRLDSMFKLSLAMDICQGMTYLHKSSIKFHGNLKSSNCVIDTRWVCKLTDFGLKKVTSGQENTEVVLGEHAYYAGFFWTAPEILRQTFDKESVTMTTSSDIYSLGIIIKELLCRNEPFCAESNMSPKEIIMKVADAEAEAENVFRPAISDLQLDSDYHNANMEYLIHRCWAQDADIRPNIKAVIRTINKLNPYKKSSVVDNMIAMMEKYTNNLEEVVAERTEQLQEEKRKTDNLLYRMLPKKVAENLKIGLSVKAETFESVTIYFSDIVEFTTLAGESTPMEIVAFLNALYTLFDDIISHYDVYKVETIGDAYMIVSGLPERNDNLHVREISGVALQILHEVTTFQIPHKPNRQLQIRIGLHTGSVVAGVVGLTMPRFCLFGDTVNTASRMESNGKALKIHISNSTREALRGFPDFHVEDRGEIPIKGKGTMRTYWLLARDGEPVCGVKQNGDDLSNDSIDLTESYSSPSRNKRNGSASPGGSSESMQTGSQDSGRHVVSPTALPIDITENPEPVEECSCNRKPCKCDGKVVSSKGHSDKVVRSSDKPQTSSDSPDYGYEGDKDSLEEGRHLNTRDSSNGYRPTSGSKYMINGDVKKPSTTREIGEIESGIKSEDTEDVVNDAKVSRANKLNDVTHRDTNLHSSSNKHSHVIKVSRSKQDGDTLLLPGNGTIKLDQLTTIRSPARVSATDFMSVNSSWSATHGSQ